MPQLIKSKFLCVLVFVLLGNLCEGQQIIQKGIQIGGGIGRDVLVTNNGYLIASADNVLIRTDSIGIPIWAYRNYYQINDNMVCFRMQYFFESNGDTSILMTGKGHLGQLYLTKSDINGVLEWGMHLHDSVPIYIFDGRDMVVHNSLIYITGYKNYAGAINGYIACFDGNGEQLWIKEYMLPTECYFNSIKIFNNTIFIAGQTDSNIADGLLLSTDLLGTPIFVKEYSGFESERFTDLEICANGDLFIVGGTSSFSSLSGQPLIIKTDNAGNILWSKVLNNPEGILRIIKFNDDLLLNTTAFPNFVICDTTGQVKTAFYTGSNLNYGQLNSKATGDGGFVSVGSFVIASQANIYLYKTDSLAGTACNSWGYNLFSTDWVPPVNTVQQMTVNSFSLIADTNYSRMNWPISNVTTLCTSSTDVDEADTDSYLFIKPNPVIDLLNIAVPTNLYGEVVLTIHNHFGAVVDITTFTVASDNIQYSSVELGAGLYYIKIESRNANVLPISSKFIKVK